MIYYELYCKHCSDATDNSGKLCITFHYVYVLYLLNYTHG